MNTHYLVCYDISEDDTRFDVAHHCKDSGLVRIQYSVFYGILSRSKLKELQLKIKESITEANADIHFIKVCSQCEKDHQIVTSINTDLLQVEVEDNTYQEVAEEYSEEVILL